jgi:Flp pilus assembly protein TadG
MSIRPRPYGRRGIESIEAAIALPIVLMAIFSGFEYSWALLRTVQLDHAARLGARHAALSGSTSADVQARVGDALESLGISSAQITIEPSQPELTAPGTAISVRIEVSYSSVGLLGLDRLMPLPSSLRGHASMVREPED